ncbi:MULTISPECIES: hypothetical protein [unclassified Janthinobacterium]|uniref:hypothetical protein n=1 Tax=unclassified Janthinobacterium TaxID=2610881 RepID=UPI0018CADF69|nr:hypothetical protein [Janthinobacterium sp. CG_23.4]MDH6157328.1 hypothetical protein [Janthinobacterium sp. CG_23.4]
MSQLPAYASPLASGSRQLAATPMPGQALQKPRAGTAGLAAMPLMQRAGQDMVALSSNALDLSTKGLQRRTDALGNATVDTAQDFLSSMTRQLFGDGASIAFDSVDLQAASSFSSGSASVSGAGNSSRAAAFSLDENAHFIGKGKITTADGQTFDFELEVQYQSNISAGVLEQTRGASQEASPEASTADDAGLPAKALAATTFAGNLHELFKLLGQQLQSSIFNQQSDGASASGKEGDLAGSLSLRLLKLVQPDNSAETAKKPVQSMPDDQARARALAIAYGADSAESTASDV